MKNNRGQTVTEMVLMLPLLMMLAGGMLFMVYTGWQDLKIQQAANVLARVEGQEKVSGGVSTDKINEENGFGDGNNFQDADNTIGASNFDDGSNDHVSSGSSKVLIQRLRNLLRGLLSGASLLQPRTGQNVDLITVTKNMKVPKLPFLKNAGLPDTIQLQGNAYGGEDPYMYALPRWGATADGSDPEWRKLLANAKKNQTQTP